MSLTLKHMLLSGYDEFAQEMEARLQPVGILEITAAAGIIRGEARLRLYNSIPDTDQPEIERIRHRIALAIRRDREELRQLQADRCLKEELDLNLPGIARARDVLKHLKKRKNEPTAEVPVEKTQNLNERTQSPAPTPTPQAGIANAECKILNLFASQEDLYRSVPGSRAWSGGHFHPLRPTHAPARHTADPAVPEHPTQTA